MPQLMIIRLVTVEATFGSDIQHDVAMKVLKEFLDAWKMNVELSDEQNKVTIDYGTERKPS